MRDRRDSEIDQQLISVSFRICLNPNLAPRGAFESENHKEEAKDVNLL